MAVSTKTLASVLDVLAAKGLPDPRRGPAGFNLALALEMGSQAMAALITERFNWKFNRAIATPFNTNAYQQDYPLPASALPEGPIAWGEDCDIVQINSNQVPLPVNWNGAITWRRNLTSTSLTRWRPSQISWMYNIDMNFGEWPGANVNLYPLLGPTAPIGQNPVLNFVDANGNLLIWVETLSTVHTGATEPMAALNAAEGTTVVDGTATWEVVSPSSQGFRLDWNPPAGQTFQLVPSYQLAPPQFTKLNQLINPFPDSYSHHFHDAVEILMKNSSPDPARKQSPAEILMQWAETKASMMKQGDQEVNAYGLVPATSAVESRWGWATAITADNPYGNQ
jgi:hypothetical protein